MWDNDNTTDNYGHDTAYWCRSSLSKDYLVEKSSASVNIVTLGLLNKDFTDGKMVLAFKYAWKCLWVWTCSLGEVVEHSTGIRCETDIISPISYGYEVSNLKEHIHQQTAFFY